MSDFHVIFCGIDSILISASRMAAEMNFRVSVVHPSDEPSPPGDWSHVDHWIDSPYDGFLHPQEDVKRTFVVVATRRLEPDLQCLRCCLRASIPFIALVGGRPRALHLRRLLEEDQPPPENLDRIRCPAGLEIGSVTPPEIGLSIAAQLVQERAKRLFGEKAFKTRPAPACSLFHIRIPEEDSR